MQPQTIQPIDLGNIPQFQAGHYAVRFAVNEKEIAEAQALRYRVFYQEKKGMASAEMIDLQREVDEWDDVAYHIIVTDQKADEAVVGTLRLMSNSRLRPGQSFYTEKAFSIEKLKNNYDRILELSRYCIDPLGRSGTILMLIWKFAMKFIMDHNYQLMLGCASFPGTDIRHHEDILTYLYNHNLAPEALRPSPIVEDAVNISSLETESPQWEDAKAAIPTLLRGYLKLGAKISDAAIIDPHFNTVFVCIYVDAEDMLKDNHTLVPR